MDENICEAGFFSTANNSLFVYFLFSLRVTYDFYHELQILSGFEKGEHCKNLKGKQQKKLKNSVAAWG